MGGSGKASVAPTDARRLLATLGAAMVATGQPVHEVQAEVRAVARQLGWSQVQVAARPTEVTVALEPGRASTLQVVAGPLRLEQADAVRQLVNRLLAGRLSPGPALDQLRELQQRSPRYAPWLRGLGWVGASVGIGMILQPDRLSLLVNAICAVLVWGLVIAAERMRFLNEVLPTVAAFLVGLLVFAADQLEYLDAPLRTVLAPLSFLLPGAALVVGLSELAAGSMGAGASRLGYGAVRLLLFALGIVAALAIIPVHPGDLNSVRVDELGWWSAPVGLLLIGIGQSVVEGVRLRLMFWITLVVAVSFGAQSWGQEFGGVALGGFLGAGAATLGAALVERIQPQLPRLVLFLPAFWLLVPGSLGLLSVTELAIGSGGQADVSFSVAVLVASIALGLLFGAAAAESMRATWRRARRHF